jgi:hypothetical protein
MITILSALTGFISATFPDLLKLYRDHQDRQHELAILELQLQQQAQGHQQRLQEIHVNADVAEASVIYQTYQTQIPWVDALNGTVRPVLAYAFFLLYASVKSLQFSLLPEAPLPWQIEHLWSLEDQAIFAGIISFYYGQRAMSKFRGRG